MGGVTSQIHDKVNLQSQFVFDASIKIAAKDMCRVILVYFSCCTWKVAKYVGIVAPIEALMMPMQNNHTITSFQGPSGTCVT